MNKPRISPDGFVQLFDEALSKQKRVLKDYLKEPNEKNIHDIRTAIRRTRAAGRVLPKKARKKWRANEYASKSKKLFKLNAKVRDLDVIALKLRAYTSDGLNLRLVQRIGTERRKLLGSARGVARKLLDLPTPEIKRKLLADSKLVKRFGTVLDRLDSKIGRGLPIVVRFEGRMAELHQLRKDCKVLRYALELSDNAKMQSKVITLLRDWQDLLGAVHDSDVTIGYLRKAQSAEELEGIIKAQALQRHKEYESFVKSCTGAVGAQKRASVLYSNL